MEGVPRMPMLEIKLKQNSFDYSGLDWPGMPSEDVHEATQQQIMEGLKKYIKEEYGDDPEKFNEPIEQFIELQNQAYRAILSPDFEGCNTLKKYYGHLHYMQSRFPFSGDEAIKVTFAWQDAFTGILTVHETFTFEQSAILFDIGAIHSLLGAIDNRTTEEGIRISCVHFQCAAGIFAYIADNFDTTMSADINQSMLKLLITLMLAQGQECLLEKSMQDNRKHSIVSKLSQQVVEYYDQCSHSFDNRDIENSLGSQSYKYWKKIINFKILYYSAITKYYMGNNSLDQDKYGQAVALYGAAVDNLTDAAKIAKNLPKEIRVKIDEAVRFSSDVLNGKHASSVKDNNFIYNDKVPNKSNLPEIKGTSLVKALPFEPANQTLTGPDIFAKLVPMEAHLAASTYSEEKAKLLRTVVDRINQKDEVLGQYKQSIELDPNKLINIEEPAKLDQELIEKSAQLSVDSSPIEELKKTMDAFTDVYSEVDTVLNEILGIIEEEETADQKLKDTCGKDAFSTQAEIEKIKKELIGHKETHHKASTMNETLHTACTMHIANMKLVAGGMDTLREELNLVNLADLLSEDDKKDVEMIRKLCDKVKEMEEQRTVLLQQLRQQMESDDVTATLVTKHGVDQEDLFKEELKKHDSLIDTINKNLTAQDNILDAVTEANARYTKIRRTVEAEKERVKTKVFNLVSSCNSFDDVGLKCAEGQKFFEGILEKAKDLLKGSEEFHDENKKKREKIYKKHEEKERAKKPPPRPTAPKPKTSVVKKPPNPSAHSAYPLGPDALTKMMAEDDDELLNDPEFLQFLRAQGSTDLLAMAPGSAPLSNSHSYGMPKQHLPSRPHTIPPQNIRYPVGSTPPLNTIPPVSPNIVPPQPSHTHPALSPLPSAATYSSVTSTVPSTTIGVPTSVNPTQTMYHTMPPSQNVASTPSVGGQTAQSDAVMTNENRLPGFEQQTSLPIQNNMGPVLNMQEMAQVNSNQRLTYQPPHSLPGQIQNYGTTDMRGYTVSKQPVRAPSPALPQSPLPHQHLSNRGVVVPHADVVDPTYLRGPVPAQIGPQVVHRANFPPQQALGADHLPPVQVSQIAIVYSHPSSQQASSSTYSQPPSFSQPAPIPVSPALTQSIPQYQHNPNINTPPTGNQPESAYPGRAYPAPFATPPSQYQPQQHPQSLDHRMSTPAAQMPYSVQPAPLQQSIANPAMPPSTMAPTGQQHFQSHGTRFQGQMQQNRYAPPINYQNLQPQMTRQGAPHAQPNLTTPYSQYNPPTSFGSNVQQTTQQVTPMNPPMKNGPNPGASYQQAPQHPVADQRQGFHVHQQYPQTAQQYNNPHQSQLPQQQQSGMGRMRPPQQYYPSENFPSQTSVSVTGAKAAPQSGMVCNQGYQHVQGQQQPLAPAQNVSQAYPQPSAQTPNINSSPYMLNAQHTNQVSRAQNPALHLVNQPAQIASNRSSEIHQYNQPGPNTRQQFSSRAAQMNVAPPALFPQNQNQSQLQNPIQNLQQRPPIMSYANQPQSLPVSIPSNQWSGNAPTVQQPVNQPRPEQRSIQQPTYSQSNNGQQIQAGKFHQPLQREYTPSQASVVPAHFNTHVHSERPSQPQPKPHTPAPQNQQPQQNYTFKSQPRPGQYVATPSNENSPKHAPNQSVAQNSSVISGNQYSNIMKPMSVLKPEPVSSTSIKLAPEPSQPSSDLAGLILTPTRSLSTSADELLSTNPDPASLPTKNNNQIVLVPTKISEDSESMVVRPVEGLPYMDEADLMKFKGQVTDFRDKVHNLLHKPKNNGLCLLDREWKQLSEEQEKFSRQLSTAVARCTSHKNRFQDIVPFDQSRVILREAKDDYINASVIDGISPFCPRFIATQSPQPNTISDFWMMVYEQHVNLIVMLVNSKDLSKKCPIYWPADRAIPQQHGPLTVSFTTSKTHSDLYVERTFTVKHKKQSLAMSVTQLQFIAWPEHRAPSSASDLIFFMNVVSNYHGLQRNLQWPVLVHCESGVGRTGVFCAFLVGISEINAGMGIVDVVNTVKKMRQKRKYMVQEKAQLKFVYDVILYHAIDVLKQRKVVLKDDVKQLPTPQQVQKLSQPAPKPNQFDIFSDNSALSSIQATVEKMTIKSGVDKDLQNDQPLMSKSLSEIETSMPSMRGAIDPNHHIHPLPITASHSFDSATIDQHPGVDGLSDLIQGTIGEPMPVLTDPPSTVSPSQPDIVESCNNQTIPENNLPATTSTQEGSEAPPIACPPLIESLSPESFTLNSDEDHSKKTKRVTRDDFFKPRSGLVKESDPSDPFSGLDPLWGLKK